MFLRLDYSSHYPELEKIIEITEEEWEKIRDLTEKFYLSDTPDGTKLLDDLESRPAVLKDMKTVTAYI